MSNEIRPYIPPEKSLPEFTVQAVLLGVVLSLIMCSANIYVGLYAGMTVSAAIPASVISMGVLRGILRRGTILENNVVHTIASSGESLAAGIIFTVPALVPSPQSQSAVWVSAVPSSYRQGAKKSGSKAKSWRRPSKKKWGIQDCELLAPIVWELCPVDLN